MRMREFNESDYDSVKVYEKDFTTAIESRYCTGLVKEELQAVSKIYYECLLRQADLSCPGCVLQMMTSVGRLYFSFKRKFEEEQKKKNEIKKKRTRKNGKDGNKAQPKDGEGSVDAPAGDKLG